MKVSPISSRELSGDVQIDDGQNVSCDPKHNQSGMEGIGTFRTVEKERKMRLIPAIRKIKGISAITVCTCAGHIIFHDGDGCPDDIAATSIVGVQNLLSLGKIIGLGKLSDILLKGKSTTAIVSAPEKIATITAEKNIDGQKLVEILHSAQWVFSSTDTKQTSAKQASPPLDFSKQVAPRLSSLTAIEPTQAKRNQKIQIASSVSAVEPERKQTVKPSVAPLSGEETIQGIRFSLFSGDLSAIETQKAKLTGQHFFSNLAEEKLFLDDLTLLCQGIERLLGNCMDASQKIVSLLDKEKNLNKTIHWAALVWHCRCDIAQGNLDAAQKKARAAYQISSDFEIASQVASCCLVADVHMMANMLDAALKVIKTGRNIARRSKQNILISALELTEAQVFAMKMKYYQSSAAAKRAMDKFPNSPYPKILLARLAILKKKYVLARQLYEGILETNPAQPDALLDQTILDSLISDKIHYDTVEIYFRIKELAPTRSRIQELDETLARIPEFGALRQLLIWRHIGKGDTTTCRLLHQPFVDYGVLNADQNALPTAEFKPGIVIGYGATAMICAPYKKIDTHMEEIAAYKDDVVHLPPPVPVPEVLDIRLSLSTEDILKLVESDSSDNIFSGDLSVFAMPDLLEFLRNGKRTGSLVCSTENGVGAIELQDGFICSAIVPNVDNIGTLLVAKGKITKERLTVAVDAQEKDISGTRIGAILVETGLVEEVSVKEAIIEQTFSAIRIMLNWPKGRFVFTPACPDEFNNRRIDIKLNTQFVLMELYKKMDEANR